jgi:hypothetical protein
MGSMLAQANVPSPIVPTDELGSARLGQLLRVPGFGRLRFGPQDELQSSSGLIVATGTGSIGWLKSLLGAEGAFDPAAPKLVFAVREA